MLGKVAEQAESTSAGTSIGSANRGWSLKRSGESYCAGQEAKDITNSRGGYAAPWSLAVELGANKHESSSELC